MVAAGVPQLCPRQVGASSCVAQLSRCCQPAVRAPAQEAGCCPRLSFQLFQLLLLAALVHRCHPVLVEVGHKELGRDASEEVLQCQELQVSLGTLWASQQLFLLQARSARLQDDGQQQRRLAFHVDISATVQSLPQLPKLCDAGSSAKYPLC